MLLVSFLVLFIVYLKEDTIIFEVLTSGGDFMELLISNQIVAMPHVISLLVTLPWLLFHHHNSLHSLMIDVHCY